MVCSVRSPRQVVCFRRLAYCSSFISFYRRLLSPPFRYVMDLYSFMFLCDLICFLILAFGYSAFGVRLDFIVNLGGLNRSGFL